jgi:hypothetical protein
MRNDGDGLTEAVFKHDPVKWPGWWPKDDIVSATHAAMKADELRKCRATQAETPQMFTEKGDSK